MISLCSPPRWAILPRTEQAAAASNAAASNGCFHSSDQISISHDHGCTVVLTSWEEKEDTNGVQSAAAYACTHARCAAVAILPDVSYMWRATS